MGDLRFLSLTDIHHASDSNYLDDAKMATPRAPRQNVFDDFHSILELKLPEEPFDLIPVTGDVTTAGRPDGLATFLKDTFPHIKNRVTDPRKICIVPGNHDVGWRLDPESGDYFDVKFGAFKQLLKDTGATSGIIPTGNVVGLLQKDPKSPDPVYVDHEKHLLVVCVNSAIRCGEVNSGIRKELSAPLHRALKSLATATGGGLTEDLQKLEKLVDEYTIFDIAHATQWQLNEIHRVLWRLKKELGNEWDGYLRVCLLHHHILPFPRESTEMRPFELMMDASNVIDTLVACDIDLVLTGHKHQPYSLVHSASGREMVIAGGPTIGGYPVNSARGFRYITLSKDRVSTNIKIWDVPCDLNRRAGGLADFLRDNKPMSFSLHGGTQNFTIAFPEPVLYAVMKQLSENPFFKEKVLFRLHFEKEKAGRVRILTEYNYNVTNRTTGEHPWHISYPFKYGHGRVLELRFEGSAVNEYSCDERGLSAVRTLHGGETASVEMKIEEIYKDLDYELYTSNCPSTDLRVAVFDETRSFKFLFENFSAGGQAPVQLESRFAEEIHLKDGLLPFQGIKLSWRHVNGKPRGARKPRDSGKH